MMFMKVEGLELLLFSSTGSHNGRQFQYYLIPLGIYLQIAVLPGLEEYVAGRIFLRSIESASDLTNSTEEQGFCYSPENKRSNMD